VVRLWYLPLNIAIGNNLLFYALGGGGGGAGKSNIAKESGLHQLYVLANSVTCVKSSGDRRFLGRGRAAQQPSTSGNSGGSLLNQIRVTDFSKEECGFIRSIALSPYCLPLLIQSLCDTIFGHEMVKLGLLLGKKSSLLRFVVSLLNKITGGVEGIFGSSDISADALATHDSDNGQKTVKVRENIHVLIVGDPGLGKVGNNCQL
jgi:hypothetical protein